MARSKTNCKNYIKGFFLVVIAYLIGSLYYDFRYLDFGYLIVVTIGFIRFIKLKENN